VVTDRFGQLIAETDQAEGKKCVTFCQKAEKRAKSVLKCSVIPGASLYFLVKKISKRDKKRKFDPPAGTKTTEVSRSDRLCIFLPLFKQKLDQSLRPFQIHGAEVLHLILVTARIWPKTHSRPICKKKSAYALFGIDEFQLSAP